MSGVREEGRGKNTLCPLPYKLSSQHDPDQKSLKAQAVRRSDFETSQVRSHSGVAGELEGHAASDAVADVVIRQIRKNTAGALLGALPDEAESEDSVRTHLVDGNRRRKRSV